MRAHRALALVHLTRRSALRSSLRARGGATARELAEDLGLGVSTVRRILREMLEDGEVERLWSTPGSHYPLTGWRLVEVTHG